MTAEELIAKYGIILTGNEKGIRVTAVDLMKREGAEETVKSHAKEIYQILIDRKMAEEKAAEERKAKVNAIPGLKEILSAHADIGKYEDEWEDSFQDVGGLDVRPKPKYNFNEMRAKYPQAFAYIRAMNMEEKSGLEAVAREAMNLILDGDWEQAVKNMDAAAAEERKREEEWVNNHMWD